MRSMTIGIAETDEEILACQPVMRELRPHCDAAELLARVRVQQREGYRLVALREGDAVVALAGYRIGHSLAWGRYLYVDDLVTDGRRRSQGHGRRLMDWLMDHAAQQGCDELHLDSGVQRFAAHRFYLRYGMDITSHHFRVRVRATPATSGRP